MAKIKEYVNVDGTPKEWTDKKEYDKHLYPEVYVAQEGSVSASYEEAFGEGGKIHSQVYHAIGLKAGEMYDFLNSLTEEERKGLSITVNDNPIKMYDIAYYEDYWGVGEASYNMEIATLDAMSGGTLYAAESFSASDSDMISASDIVKFYLP